METINLKGKSRKKIYVGGKIAQKKGGAQERESERKEGIRWSTVMSLRHLVAKTAEIYEHDVVRLTVAFVGPSWCLLVRGPTTAGGPFHRRN